MRCSRGEHRRRHHDQDRQPRFSGDVTAYLKNGRRSEVDFARRLWTLPPGRMKSAKQHVVPLSTAALAVLHRQQRVRSGEAVFPGRSGATALLCQLRHRASQGQDSRCLHAAWLAKLLS
jgi:integrase